MADSNLTKQAMAAAFKALLLDQPFEKISVSDICDRCNMNRKSFYYHFRDKFDLTNWIFDTEFTELAEQRDMDLHTESSTFAERWDDLAAVCSYFYDNRQFYQRVLQVEGQNSFCEHFREFLKPYLRARTALLFGSSEIPAIVYDFILDGIVCAFERWLLQKNCVTAEEFLQSIKQMLQIVILGLGRRIQEEPTWLEELYKTE